MVGTSIPAATTTAGRAAAAHAPFSSDGAQFRIGLAIILVVGIAPGLLGNSYWEHTFQLVTLYFAVAILQNFLFVDAGQKSFGQGA
ncbi:MAG: hypothetical protein ACK5YI_04825, partial [Rhodospirillales bacterium]